MRNKVRLVVVGNGAFLLKLRELSREAGMDDLIWFAGERHDWRHIMQP